MNKIIKIDDKVFFVKKKDMTEKKFLEKFNAKKNTYLYNLYKRLYSYIAGNSTNLYKEYKFYYSKEYVSFDKFLLDHYNISDEDVKFFNNRYSYYKYVDIGNEQPLYSLMMNDTIKRIINDFMGGFEYED